MCAMQTVNSPLIRSSSAIIRCGSKAFSTKDQHSFKYFSRYFGKIVKNELSSNKPGKLRNKHYITN